MQNFLGGLFGQQQLGMQRQEGPNGLDLLRNPNSALPIAAALLGGRNNRESFGNAFATAGDARQSAMKRQQEQQQKNRTLEYLKQKRPDLAAQVAAGMPVAEAWRVANTQPKAQLPKVSEFFDEKTGQPYKAQWNPQSNAWDRIGGTKAQSNSGFEVTLPDGSTIRQGSFGKQDEKNVANRVKDEQDAAAVAAGLKQTVQMLRQANQNVGYSGVGGSVYGAVDDTLEQLGAPNLPGNARSRATMKSGGLQIALSNVSKTKGAISNAEMKLFMEASPGLQNVPGGNEALLDMVDAIADRQLARVSEMEKWRQQYGTLDGFEGEWGRFIQENPLILPDSQGSIRLNSGSSDASADLTGMSDEELEAIANGG